MRYWNKIWVLLLLTCLSVGIGQAQSYRPDMMSIEEFKNEALKVKEEVWVVDFWASWGLE